MGEYSLESYTEKNCRALNKQRLHKPLSSCPPPLSQLLFSLGVYSLLFLSLVSEPVVFFPTLAFVHC